jgi:hypothetical protein
MFLSLGRVVMRFSPCQGHIFYKILEVEVANVQGDLVSLWQEQMAVLLVAVWQASLLQLLLYR